MPTHRIFATPFASVYPLYVQKAERKNRTKEEIDHIICWLTGYSQAGLQRQIEQENDFETFAVSLFESRWDVSLCAVEAIGIQTSQEGKDSCAA